MIRVFADASALYSAIISKRGGSREILKHHKKGAIQLVVSEYVVLETRRNLELDHPTLAGSIEIIVDVLTIDVVTPSKASIQQVMAYTEPKDAPVIAAAIDGHCKYLLTYDRQHLLGVRHVAEKSGLKILTSGDLLQILRREE